MIGFPAGMALALLESQQQRYRQFVNQVLGTQSEVGSFQAVYKADEYLNFVMYID